jgi:putative endonuclease
MKSSFTSWNVARGFSLVQRRDGSTLKGRTTIVLGIAATEIATHLSGARNDDPSLPSRGISSFCLCEERDSSLTLGTGSAISDTMAAVSRQYYVYIMTNNGNTVLYVGVTNDLIRRVYEHKEKLANGFTRKYNVVKLVYYEILEDIQNAILREKQIKAGSRQKKVQLINSVNKEWHDLYDQL